MMNNVKVQAQNGRSIIVAEDGKLIVAAPNCYAGGASGNTKKYAINLRKNKGLAAMLRKAVLDTRKGCFSTNCSCTTVKALINFEEERKFADLSINFEYRDEIGEIVISATVDKLTYVSVALPTVHGNGYAWSREVVNCKAVDNAYVRILAILADICD